ncbi:hydantoinase B/oxoprolinase family protein [Aureimonas populi]|uniref:Hydantoinase B/oxoprolinase family protein n=1 Tax=Aureimonas populi TaxID=1701758 RepID=A0ABW5CLQ2_9HYPH|nr:hydantoinase B/oxoprolinase family protein [Aureimonas populi]
MRNGLEAGALDVLQMRLDAIAAGMQATLFRTAVSPVVREGGDASCAIFTEGGELLALSDAIPLLLGALPGAVRAILARFPAGEMAEGDIFLMNDPFAGGTHLPDITVLVPVFSGSALVAFAASILHHQDIGGMRPGSVPPDATDIFQEGIRLPPMRLARGGRLLPEVEELIGFNSRAPGIVLGDIAAQVAAGVSAARALQTVAAELGEALFLQRSAACLSRSETQARRFLETMPEGPFAGADGLDPTPGLPPVEVRLSLSFAGGRMRADFSGSSPQVAAPINCVRSGPLSSALYVLLSLLPPTIGRNGGILRLLTLELPEASVVNAAPPAAVNARMGMVRSITSALLQAVSQAIPERMPAANSGMSYVLAFSGNWPDGRRFVTTEIIAGGAGGGPQKRGADAVSTDVGNAMNMPVEALEDIAPIRLVSARIRRGSGGRGRFDGGDGIERVYEALADGISVSLRGERFTRVPQGLRGGGAPSPSRATVLRAGGDSIPLASRSTVRLDRGDRLVVESCGGAGYGTPP